MDSSGEQGGAPRLARPSLERLSARVAFLERDAVRLVRLDPKGRDRPSAVTDTHAVPAGADEDALDVEKMIDGLALALEEAGLSKKGWIVALPDPLFALDILSFPKVARKHLEAMIQRKIAGASQAEGGDQAWCYEVLPSGEEGDPQALKVLIARIPVFLLRKIHTALAGHKIRPRFLTPAFSGVLGWMAARSRPREAAPVLAMALGRDSAILSVFAERRLLQVRFLKSKTLADKILHVFLIESPSHIQIGTIQRGLNGLTKHFFIIVRV